MLGTRAAVYGWFVEPIGWSLALIVWGYALVWFLVNNMVKRLVVHLLAGAGPGEASYHISEITA